MIEPEQKRGRPRTYLSPRYALAVMTSLELREKLKAAARKANHSVTREVEERLEQSFKEKK